MAAIKPNKRAAVPLPHPGQSVNPTDTDHQRALQVATKALVKKRERNNRVVQFLTRTTVRGVDEPRQVYQMSVDAMHSSTKNEPCVDNTIVTGKQIAQPKSKATRKKIAKKEKTQTAKQSAKFRRRPDRRGVLKDVEDVDVIRQTVDATRNAQESRRLLKQLERKAGQKIAPRTSEVTLSRSGTTGTLPSKLNRGAAPRLNGRYVDESMN